MGTSSTAPGVVAALDRFGGRVRGKSSANGLSTLDAVLPVAGVRQLQNQLPGLSMGEGSWGPASAATSRSAATRRAAPSRLPVDRPGGRPSATPTSDEGRLGAAGWKRPSAGMERQAVGEVAASSARVEAQASDSPREFDSESAGVDSAGGGWVLALESFVGGACF
jgi:hypothetical protein